MSWTSAKEKIILCEIPEKPSEVIGVDLFTTNNSNYLCGIDYDNRR